MRRAAGRLGGVTIEAMIFIIAVVLALYTAMPFLRDAMAYHWKRSADAISFVPYGE